MKSLNEVETFYTQTICPRLNTLEAKRKRYKLVVIIFTLVLLCFVVGAFAINIVFGIILSIVAFFLWAGLEGKYIDSLSREFKPYMKEVLEFTIPNVKYDPAGKIEAEVFEKSNLMLRKTIDFKSDDYGIGEVNKIKYEFCEVRTQYVKSKAKRTRDKLFGGFFFTAKLPMQNETNVLITPKKGMYMSVEKASAKGYKLVTDNSAFVAQYNFMTDNIGDAVRLFTPGVKEHLLNLKQKPPHLVAAVHVKGNRLYMTIEHQNGLFDSQLFHSMLNPDNATYWVLFFYHAFALCNLLIQNSEKEKVS